MPPAPRSGGGLTVAVTGPTGEIGKPFIEALEKAPAREVARIVGMARRPFDPAEQGMVTGARDTTTVASQALFLLNDPFIRRQSRGLAERAPISTFRTLS